MSIKVGHYWIVKKNNNNWVCFKRELKKKKTQNKTAECLVDFTF